MRFVLYQVLILLARLQRTQNRINGQAHETSFQ
jgi:hypothetical protein